MNLKTLRASLGFTQAQMADRLGVSLPTYNKYENENSAGMQELIAKEFGVDVVIDQLGGIDYLYPQKEKTT